MHIIGAKVDKWTRKQWTWGFLQIAGDIGSDNGKPLNTESLDGSATLFSVLKMCVCKITLYHTFQLPNFQQRITVWKQEHGFPETFLLEGQTKD